MAMMSLTKKLGPLHASAWLFKSWAEPRGAYLGQFLPGMCRWPLRTPTPLLSILWPIIDPILVTFEQT